MIKVARMPPMPAKTGSDGLLTIGQVAEILGVSAATLRRWDRAGRFRARRHPINGYRLYRRQDVERLRWKLVQGVGG